MGVQMGVQMGSTRGPDGGLKGEIHVLSRPVLLTESHEMSFKAFS